MASGVAFLCRCAATARCCSGGAGARAARRHAGGALDRLGARRAPGDPLAAGAGARRLAAVPGQVEHSFTHFDLVLTVHAAKVAAGERGAASRPGAGSLSRLSIRRRSPSVMRKVAAHVLAPQLERGRRLQVRRRRGRAWCAAPGAAGRWGSGGRCGSNVPEGPAVAGVGALDMGADLVDRAGDASPHRRACRRRARARHGARADRCSMVAGRIRPRSTQRAEGDARLGALAFGRRRAAARRCGRTAVDAARARRRYRSASRSTPTKRRPSRLATAPVVPVPKKGRGRRRPAWSRRRMTRCSSASGFWVGMGLGAGRRPSAARSPVQIGSSQSERICRSSLSAFMAS